VHVHKQGPVPPLLPRHWDRLSGKGPFFPGLIWFQKDRIQLILSTGYLWWPRPKNEKWVG
jgi:hypothetical protein